jgi:hypothetical protein
VTWNELHTPAVNITYISGSSQHHYLFFSPDIRISMHCNIIQSYSQLDATFLDLFISTDALHVSGGSSAHHREHITVHTASGIVNQYCCLLQQAAVLVDNT